MSITLAAALAAAVAATGHRFDANETRFFARELEHVMSKTFDLIFPAFRGRQLVSVNSEGGPGLEFITWKEYEPFGMAEVISNYANGLPQVAVKGTEQSAPVRTIGLSYRYSLEDVKKAQRAGRPLASSEAAAARRGIEQKIDSIIFSGDAAHGLLGLANQTNATAANVPNGAAVSPLWANKTPLEITADLHSAANTIVTTTKDAENPNTIAMPLVSYQKIATTPMSATDPRSILSAFLAASPYITRILPASKLEALGAGGTRRMIVFDSSPDVVEMHIPEEFNQLPAAPINAGMAWEIPCLATVGGVTLYRPMAMRYSDGM